MVWGVLWLVIAVTARRHETDQIALVFGGWMIGWTSATIARLVYPPPKRRPSAGPRSFFQGFRAE